MAKKKEEIEEVEIATEEKKCCTIDELSVSFNNEDMNKLVEKINEIIKKQNGC